MMKPGKPGPIFTRDGIVAIVMIGIAVAFLVTGKNEDPQLFVMSAGLSFAFFLVTLFRWENRWWLRLLAYSVLLLSVFWDREHPQDAVFGLSIVILTSLLQGDDRDEDEAFEEVSSIFGVEVEQDQ